MTENEQVTCQNSALIDFYRFLQIPNRLSPLQRPFCRRLRVSGFWFPPPWQAAAGLGGSSLEVLIHGLDLLPAVAAAHPAGVAMGVAGDEVKDGQQAEPFASEVLWRAGHWGVSGG